MRPAHALDRTRAHIGTVVGLPIGVDFATLSTAVLHLPLGEHVVVVGPARSGRSSGLTRLIEAWRALHPGAPVRVICRVSQFTARRSVRRRRADGTFHRHALVAIATANGSTTPMAGWPPSSAGHRHDHGVRRRSRRLDARRLRPLDDGVPPQPARTGDGGRRRARRRPARCGSPMRDPDSTAAGVGLARRRERPVAGPDRAR